MLVKLPGLGGDGVRGLRLVAGSLVAFVGASASLVGWSLPAFALAGCPSSAILAPFASGTAGLCVERLTGKTIGEVSNTGRYLAVGSSEFAVPGAIASTVNKPSSVLAAAESPGMSTAEKSSMAGANGARTGLSFTKTLGTVGLIITAGTVGYELGKGVDKFSCSLGLEALCSPSKSSTFVPNQNVVVGTGWTTQSGSWHDNSNGWDWTGTWGIAGTPPAYGAHDVVVSNVIDLNVPSLGYFSVGSVTASYFCRASDESVSAPDYQSAYYSLDSRRSPNAARYDSVAFNYDGFNVCSGGQGFDHLELYRNGGTLATFYPTGNPLNTSGGVADPARSWKASLNCVRISDASPLTVNGTSASFSELDPILPSFPDVSCPAGYREVSHNVQEITPGADPTDVASVTVPAPVQDWQQNYPQCGDGACQLTLFKRSGAELLNCFATKGVCENWFRDPAKVDSYVCKYGLSGTGSDATQPLSECNVYSPMFDPLPNAKGIKTGDPATGDSPEQPVSDPAVVPVPGPGGGGDSCFPRGWSAFNPVEWVLEPLQCAFIPSPEAVNGFVGTVTTAYNGTAIGEWFSAIAGVGNVVVPDGGCEGVQLRIPTLVGDGPGQTVSLFRTCDEPWHTVALVVKSMLIVMICWGAAVGVFRNIAAGFGLNVDWGRRNGG